MFSTIAIAQQENGQYIHKHLLRADASIVAGNMFKSNLSNVYVDGNLEYYLDNKISIRGDGIFLVGSKGLTDDSVGLKDNHSLCLGVDYHFHTNSHLDPYFVFQPGLAYTSSYKQMAGPILYGSEQSNTKHYYSATLSPYASAGFGVNYYFQYVAHLFLEARYVYENHMSDAPKPMSLEEVRITFGLGFNLFIIKDKKKKTA
jgi:hypothetical protein